MDDLEKFATPIIVGLLSGAFGSLIGPYINWRIERKRLRHQSRKEKIQEWRTQLENAKAFSDIQRTLLWEDLRPYLTETEVKFMSSMVATVGGGPSGEEQKLSKLLAVVSRIQKEWGII